MSLVIVQYILGGGAVRLFVFIFIGAMLLFNTSFMNSSNHSSKNNVSHQSLTAVN